MISISGSSDGSPFRCHYYQDDDDSKTVDRDNWGVTLIIAKGNSFRNHHAQILIEKVNDSDEYEKTIVDLIAGDSASDCIFAKTGKVRIFNDVQQIGDSGHSETWIRSADLVQAMLNQVEIEKENPLAHPRAFSIFGRESELAPPLKIHKISDPALQQAYKRKPKLLIKIFKKYNNFKKVTRCRNFFLWARGVHHLEFDRLQKHTKVNEGVKKGTLFGLALTPIILVAPVICGEAHVARKVIYRQLDLYTDMKKLALKGINTFSDVLGINDIVQSHDDRSLFFQDKMVSGFLSRVGRGIEEKAVARDNCCTWALEKLEMVGVDKPTTGKKWFITDTRAILKKKFAEDDVGQPGTRQE